MTDLLIDQIRHELSFWLDRGARLAEVEDQLIDVAPGLSEDERAALWLFAWSYRPPGLVAHDDLVGIRA
jgi:hypothetical protein